VRIAPALRDDVIARTDLIRLSASTPSPKARPQLGAPARAARLVAWYREAARRFHIRWQLLAAINFVESAFNRVRNVSGAGAEGPMQFEPATWKAYGLGGDVREPHDAILGAANYLAASNARHDERTALYRYNHSPLYVDAILRYARRMQHDRYAFYEYYSWQVYFRTATGYRRLTGPR
jgi:soluble lytic murein transglycosylase-like protein